MTKRRSSGPSSRRGRSLRPRTSQRGAEDRASMPPTALDAVAWENESIPPGADDEGAEATEGESLAPPPAPETKASPAEAPAPDTKASEAPKTEIEAPAPKVETPAPAAKESEAEPKAEARAEAAPKAESAEPAPVAEAKAEEPAPKAKAEEPAPKAKAEEPAVQVVEAKAAEPPKGKAAEASRKSDKGDKNKGKNKGPEPKRDAEKKAEEKAEKKADGDDAPRSKREGHPEGGSSLESGEFSSFFKKESDSVPPVGSSHHDDHHDDLHDDHGPVITAETLERRARLRRVVAGVVAVAALISVVVIGRSLAKKPATTVPTTSAEVPRPAPPPSVAAPTSAAPVAPPAPVASAQPVASAEPLASASAPPVDSAVPSASAAPAAGSADAAALTKEAYALLNRGKRTEAMAVARRAIEADPSDANPYLYLGSALQESGKWKEGVEAYSECVRHATKGPVYECRAMGGKK